MSFDGKTTRGPWRPCPGCGKQVDSLKNATGDGAPDPGDIVICFYCGHINAIDEDRFSLRELTDAEIREVAGDRRLIKAQKLRDQAMRRFRQWKASQ